jgi:hypothetical protein
VDGGYHLYTLLTMTEVPTLSCARCGTMIGEEELGSGLAVRVDGELVCEMCVDTLPSAAVVRINQVRALRGLEATTYLVKLKHLPRVQLYSFTTSVNITQHRRKVATDGFFEAPLLPPPEERENLTTATTGSVITDRVARGQFPAKIPMLIAAAVTLVVLGGIAFAFAMMSPATKPDARQEERVELPESKPIIALKTRIDYSIDAFDAWMQASSDRDCPTLVLQGISQELMRHRTRQLDEAETAIDERRLDDAAVKLNVSTLPDDISFRQGRSRESELRARLLTARTVATVKPTTITPQSISSVITPAQTVITPVPATVTETPSTITLTVASAKITGDLLRKVGDAFLGYWTNPADSAWWTVSIPKSSNYRITALASGLSNNIWLAVEVDGQVLAAPAMNTKGYEDHQELNFGVMNIAASNNLTVRLRSFDPQNWKPVIVRSVTLTPTTDAITPPPAAPAAPAPTPPVPTPPVAKISEPPVVLTTWNGLFVIEKNKKQPKSLPLDGTILVPPGLPGGATHVFRSSKSNILKRHAVTIDLGRSSATNGGVALLIHPGRNDRTEIVPSLTDAKGITVKFPPMALPEGEWTTLLLPTPADGTLDASQLARLTLEDNAKAAYIPEDGGFFIAKVVSVSGHPVTASDLQVRPCPLLVDKKQLINLRTLIETLAKIRKRDSKNMIIPSNLRFLIGDCGNDPYVQNVISQGFSPLNDLPNPLFINMNLFFDMSFSDRWLDALTEKSDDSILDPQRTHIAVIWTGGNEAAAFPDAQQAISHFWKKRLDQILQAGILPVVVIGTNRQRGDKREVAEQIWKLFVAMPQVKQSGIPVIDLRGLSNLPLNANGQWNAETSQLVGTLVADGLDQVLYALRCLKVAK